MTIDDAFAHDPESRREYESYLDEVDAYLDYDDDGQPTPYEEWQDCYGDDDWAHGQYDSCDY